MPAGGQTTSLREAALSRRKCRYGTYEDGSCRPKPQGYKIRPEQRDSREIFLGPKGAFSNRRHRHRKIV